MHRFKLLIFTLLLTLIHAYAPAQEPNQQSERVKKILEEVDDMWRGRSSRGVMTMQVKTRHYTRTMKMEFWSKGKEKSLVRIISPLKEKGTATLKSNTSIYTYLPKTDRTIRLTSGMMMGSWMGSHFTNDDLVKESRLSEDYFSKITFEGEKQGQSVIEFDLIPRLDAAVVWGKIRITIQSEGHFPIEEIYYDEDMQVMRKIHFSEIKKMGSRRLPTVMKVVPEEKPGEYTQIVYKEIRFDLDLEDSFFSLGSLRRR